MSAGLGGAGGTAPAPAPDPPPGVASGRSAPRAPPGGAPDPPPGSTLPAWTVVPSALSAPSLSASGAPVRPRHR